MIGSRYTGAALGLGFGMAIVAGLFAVAAHAGEPADELARRLAGVKFDLYAAAPGYSEGPTWRKGEVLFCSGGLMPSLMEIFAGSDEVVRFEPVGPQDVAAAEQETDYVNHVFMQQNPGFLILYGFIKDALLSKVGIVKVWWEEHEEEERETYLDQGDDAFALLVADPDIEIVAHSARPDPAYQAATMLPQPPIERAGFVPGDQVVRVGDLAVTNALDIERGLLEARPGQPSKVAIVRAGKPSELALEVKAAEGKLNIDFKSTPQMTGVLEHWQYDTFITRFTDKTIEPAYVTFSLGADGQPDRITMKAVSPLADFSYDYQDLLFSPVRK